MSAALENQPSNNSSNKKRSRVLKFDENDNDKRLRDLLYSWRDRRAAEVLAPALFTDFGPWLFIPDAIIERIIVCAHGLKENFKTEDDMRRETQCRRAVKFSVEIYEIIKSIWPAPLPPSPFTSTPLRPPLQPRPLTGNVTETPTPSGKRPICCGKCKQYGHNGKRIYYRRNCY